MALRPNGMCARAAEGRCAQQWRWRRGWGEGWGGGNGTLRRSTMMANSLATMGTEEYAGTPVTDTVVLGPGRRDLLLDDPCLTWRSNRCRCCRRTCASQEKRGRDEGGGAENMRWGGWAGGSRSFQRSQAVSSILGAPRVQGVTGWPWLPREPDSEPPISLAPVTTSASPRTTVRGGVGKRANRRRAPVLLLPKDRYDHKFRPCRGRSRRRRSCPGAACRCERGRIVA